MVRIILRLDLFIEQLFPRRRSLITQALDIIQRINRQTKPIRTVPNRQLKRRIDIALLPVPADQQILLALATIRKTVHEPGIRVKVENTRYVICKDGLVLMCLETMRMLRVINEFEQVDYVYEADFEVGEVCAEEGGGGEGFVRRHVAAGGHYNVWFSAAVVAGPLPDADTFCAVGDGLVHSEVLQVFLLVGDDYVDVVFAAEAVVHG